MATTTTPPPQAPAPKTNRIGLTVMEYKGGKTTLCAGCGHNAISERIIEAMYEMGVEPEFVIKPSGIGCSSKTPAYFLSRSHSFNAVHGRMPSVATGAMLKAAIAHKGTVMLDVVSPCVTFNDHEGSTKSYKYVKEHEETLQEVSFVPHFEDIAVEYDPGTMLNVTMHDGSHLQLRKLEEDYDPTDRIHAMSRLTKAHDAGQVLTGVFYVNTKAPNFLEMLNMTDQPLATLPESVTRPGREVLEAAMKELQ